jgi:hypothetical protein
LNVLVSSGEVRGFFSSLFSDMSNNGLYYVY